LGTAGGTIITVLVNGVVIAQTILGPKDGEATEPGEEPTKYALDIRVQDQERVQRTNLAADDQDLLWIYAHVRCSDPDVDTQALTEAIAFTKQGPNASWLVLGEAQMRGGFKTVPVRARPPSQEAVLSGDGATVLVSALIEGRRVSGPVDLQLEHYVMEFLPPLA